MNAPFVRSKLERYGKLLREAQQREAKFPQSQRGWYDDDGVRQGGLIAFVRYFWHVLEPETPFVDGWPLWSICEHLEACAYGDVSRLLINVPPGFCKSLMTNVFFPAWIWGPLKQPHKRFLSFSYSASLTERDNDKFRTLITSAFYQELYGPLRTRLKTVSYQVEEQDEQGGVVLRNKTTIKVMNTRTGWKLASSVGGVGTGERADFVCIDDPHNVTEAESEKERGKAVQWFRESVSSRFNDLDTGVLMVILQRVHADDVSGVALSPDFDYCHLMIPWEFDPTRAFDDDGNLVKNQIGWFDPRADENDPNANDGEPAWVDRFSEGAIDRLKKELGPYGWASQFQQSPVPRGGGLFKRHWWKPWAPEDGKYPAFDFVLASLDAAVTEKEENCPAGLTVWGIFTPPDTPDFPAVMLIDSWRKRLNLHGIETPRQGMEIPQLGDSMERRRQRDMMWCRRVGHQWGLVEWLAYTCRFRFVDLLIIETEKGGIAAAQELQRLHGNESWGVQMRTVVGDKYARAYAVVPMFSQGKVWAPIKDWAEDVIEEMESFPRGKFKDLTDSTTQALKYLREVGMLQMSDEIRHAERERGLHKPQRKALYPV